MQKNMIAILRKKVHPLFQFLNFLYSFEVYKYQLFYRLINYF